MNRANIRSARMLWWRMADLALLVLAIWTLTICMWDLGDTFNFFSCVVFSVAGLILIVWGLTIFGLGLLGDIWGLLKKAPVTAFFLLLSIVASILFVCANRLVLESGELIIIAAPCVFLAPLWIAGLDRLHKYYSELQARIAGNILRLEKNTEQKMVDLITQSNSLASLQKNLAEAVSNKTTLLDFLDGFIKSGGSTNQP